MILRLAAVFMAVLPWFGRAEAQESAVTEPRGIYTVKIPGAPSAGTTARTYLGVQLLTGTRFVGLVQTVNGATLQLQAYGDHHSIADPARTCYLHVLTGDGRGFVTDITEYRTTELVCAENLTPWVAPGTKVLIRPHPLLSDLFGTANTYGLGTGADAESADNVVIWDPDTQQERVFYYHSTRARWEEKGIAADAGGATLRFPHGFYIVRRTPGTLRIKISGEIGGNAVLLPARPGACVFSLPVNLTGSLDAMVRATGDHAVVSGPNAGTADLLTFEETSTGMQRGPFYHLSRGEVSGWREVGVDDSTAAVQPMDFLSTLILRRESGNGRVLVEGSLEPPATPRPPLPPDPEPGEIPLKGEFAKPRVPPGDVSYQIETSTDLQTWTTYAIPVEENGKLVFDLPSGQGRAFYRVRVTLF